MINLNQSSEEDITEFMHEYMDFDPNRAYLLIAMARPKENEHLSHGDMPLFREIITDQENIDRKFNDLRMRAEGYRSMNKNDTTFRMYLSANARDIQKSFHIYQKNLIDLSKNIMEGHKESQEKMKRLDSEWKSTLQTEGNKDDNRFIIDIDTEDRNEFEEIRSIIDSQTDTLYHIKTPNGHHLITNPFNYTEFPTDKYPCEIKLDDIFFLSYI